jgi:hypothetical protein
MGETLDKNTSMKTKDTLKDDIVVCNKITGNELFKRKTGFTLTFNFHGVQNILAYLMLESSKLNQIDGDFNQSENIIESITKII